MPLRVSLGALLVALICTPAVAHDAPSGWSYSASCCDTQDCHPVAPGEVVETPRGNLVAGMKWLQNAYTRRFNTRHGLWGRLFGDRYKAIPVESGLGDYYGRLADYDAGGRVEVAGLPHGNDAVVRQADGVALAEVLDADAPAFQFVDPDVVLGDVEILDDAARDVVALGPAPELDRALRVLELLLFTLVADGEP